MQHESSNQLHIVLADETATSQLGFDLAMALSGSAIIHLEGDLGAGKSTLARAFIRQKLGDHEMEVPSPTFSLVQAYENNQTGQADEILHADLYRLSDAQEVEELGINRSENTIVLIEWPQNGDIFLDEPDLTIKMDIFEGADGEDQRQALITGNSKTVNALKRSLKIRSFLKECWGSSIKRQPLQGDASTRSYEFVSNGYQRRILMNAPKQPDGPIIKDGKPYSQIAHLAEDVSAFVGVSKILEQSDIRVPFIHAQNIADGLLMLEDLGSDLIIDGERKPIEIRYMASAAMLADFHREKHHLEISVGEELTHHIPDYDPDAMLIEVDLLAKWYAPRFKGAGLTKQEESEFLDIWNGLIDRLKDSEKKICMRDFHSPNIIWRGRETGHKKVAVIDFQDAVYGPSAYDLASLAQDARIDVPIDLEKKLVDHYCSQRANEPDFNEALFRQDYAIMAALRTTKILGIFVRLDERDNKPDYLKHLPRMQDYIKRAMTHPVLRDYKAWYENVMEL